MLDIRNKDFVTHTLQQLSLEVTFSINGFENINNNIPTRVNTNTSTINEYTLSNNRTGNNLYIFNEDHR